jgi:alanyl-tRNA synthetase
VLRKCINISEKDFHTENLLPSTIPVVADILGETFPELNERLPSVLEIVKYEQELFKSLRDTMSKDVKQIIKQNPKLAELEMYDYPGFVQGYQDFSVYKKDNKKHITGDFMYHMHSSFGFDLELIERLAELEGMTIDKTGFEEKMTQVKKSFSEKLINAEMVTALDNLLKEATENDFKYEYSFDGSHQTYHVEPLKSKIVSIVDQTGSVNCTSEVTGSTVKLILQQSPFYYESGGQEGDSGFIFKNGKKFPLKSLSNRKNCVLHEIEVNRDESLSVGDEVQLHVDEEKRSALTRNHSATHLLNSALRKVTQSPIYQKSSLVTGDQLKIELACFGPKLNHQHVENLEDLIRSYITERPLERKIRVINSQDLQNESDVVMVPGEVYPDDGIRLVSFGDFSKELCCGTHVFNTRELLEFTFLSMRSTGRNSYLFAATTGPDAVKAIFVGDQLVNELKNINCEITAENFNEVLSKVREVSIKLNNSNVPVSFLKKLECQNLTAEIKEKVKHESREIVSELLDVEMKKIAEETAQAPFVVHFLSCSDLMKSVSLQKATRFVKNRPILVISLTDNAVKARCCVPQQFTSDKFTAETWLREFAKHFKANVAPPKGQDPKEVSNMKEKKVDPEKFAELLRNAISTANAFAKNI